MNYDSLQGIADSSRSWKHKSDNNIMIRSNLSTTEYWWSLAGDINQSNALNK